MTKNKLTSDRETILSHLKALRKVLITSSITIAIGFLVALIGFSDLLLTWLSQPLIDRNVEIVNTGLADVFVTQLKISLVAGAIIASPVVFWQIWSFLKPALYPNERTMFRLTFAAIMILFTSGVLFGYFMVFSITINFFLITGYGIATPMISIDRYISMLFNFIIPFGLAFQFPIVITVLAKLGVVSTPGLVKARKYVIFANFVLAAVLTPPDVLSQIMLAVPMCVLYEIGIIVSRFLKMSENKEALANGS